MKDWATYPLEVMARGHVLSDVELQEMCAEFERMRKDRDVWRDAVGHLLAAVPVAEIVGAGASMANLADWMKARHKDAERVSVLEKALREIEILYWQEGKDAGWRAAHMNGIARAAFEDGDVMLNGLDIIEVQPGTVIKHNHQEFTVTEAEVVRKDRCLYMTPTQVATIKDQCG